MRVLKDVDCWYRKGRGRGIDFVANDQEFVQIVLEGVPDRYAPFDLIGHTWQQVSKKLYKHVPFVYPLDELPLVFADHDDTLIQLFVRSHVAHQEVDVSNLDYIDRYCSLNGMIALQHYRDFADVKRSSSIGLVDKVEHELTEEVREYKDAYAIFRSLKRRARKEVVYADMYNDLAGNEIIDTKYDLWTEGAKRLYDQGVKFHLHWPGPRLK